MAKIKTIEYFRVKPRWLMVKITDETGEHGWGEATLEGHDLAVEGTLDEMIVRLIGMDARFDRLQYFGIVSLILFKVTSNISGRSSGDTASTAEAQFSCLLFPALILRYGI